MSLATWKAEFYPVEAKDATGSALEAAEHSLRKWKGARPDNQARHGVCSGWARLGDGDDFIIFSSSTCALCEIAGRGGDGGLDCHSCPGEIANGGVPCHGYVRSPFGMFNVGNDPEPMIAWLENAVEYCKNQALVESDESYQASEALLHARAK